MSKKEDLQEIKELLQEIAKLLKDKDAETIPAPYPYWPNYPGPYIGDYPPYPGTWITYYSDNTTENVWQP